MLQRLLLESLPAESDPPPVTPEQVGKLVQILKNNKAADSYSITSEHIKLVPNIAPIIATLLNQIFKLGLIRIDMKIGLKKEKSKTDPDKFRQITISSLLCKILEKCMVNLSSPLDEAQSP